MIPSAKMRVSFPVRTIMPILTKTYETYYVSSVIYQNNYMGGGKLKEKYEHRIY